MEDQDGLLKMKNIKKWVWINKEGFLVGTIFALIIYYMKWTLPIKLPVEGIPKLILMIIILGGIGAIIDSIYAPSK